jgi:neprilysin
LLKRDVKSKASHPYDDICLSPSCVKAAASILEKIDETVSPCKDFYHFACGQYVKNTVIPEDKVSVDSFSVVRDTLQEQLKTIITAPIDENDIEPIKKVKNLYAACMDKEAVEKRGLVGITEIQNSMGGWPAVKGDKWNEDSWTWQKVAIDCRKHGYSTDYVVDFFVGTDLKNSSMKIVDVGNSNFQFKLL